MTQLMLGVLASAYALSLPFAGWLVWEAGRVRRASRHGDARR